jgi:hypothetical protein
MTRTGKIARLPREIREALNRRLENGEPGKRLVRWLNATPEVRALLHAEFGGRAISEQNLSEWKQGGYREWQARQKTLEQAGELASTADELSERTGALAESLAKVLTARYMVALAEWDGKEESGLGRTLRLLRPLCQDVVALRRSEHSAARLEIQQTRLEREQDQWEEEMRERIQRLAERSALMSSMLGQSSRPESEEPPIGEGFGLAPTESADRASLSDPGRTPAASETEPGSNRIKPNQTNTEK